MSASKPHFDFDGPLANEERYDVEHDGGSDDEKGVFWMAFSFGKVQLRHDRVDDQHERPDIKMAKEWQFAIKRRPLYALALNSIYHRPIFSRLQYGRRVSDRHESAN